MAGRMNLGELQRKLILAARSDAPREEVPYAFEKRIMARLRAAPVVDQWEQWAAALWRAAAPCIAIMVLFSAWSLLAPANPPASDLSQELENTILAAADQEQPADFGR